MGKRRRKRHAHDVPVSQPTPVPKSGKRHALLFVALGLTAALFLPSLPNGFVSLDDPVYVIDNPTIKAWSWQHLKTIFTEPVVGTYLPVTMLSYMIDHQLFGLNPLGYHLTNLVLHLLCTWLVFLVIDRIVGHAVAAFVSATLFGIHTMHVESVAWISERKDVLYGVGFLGALYLYVAHVRTGKRFTFYYWASLLVFVASALSKAQAALLPVVLILVELVLMRPFSVKALARTLPFFIPAILTAGVAVATQRAAGAVSELDTAPPVYRIFLGCYALMNYVWRLMLPVNLSVVYPYPVSGGRITTQWVYLSPLALLPVGWAAYWLARKSRELLFGLSFFALTIAPFLQFFPLGSALYADRYTYISSIGLFLVAGILVTTALDAGGYRARALLAVGGIYLVFLAGNTFNRTQVWHDSMKLYTDGIEKEPTAAMLYFLRADLYERQGDAKKALDDWNEAARHAPGNIDTYARRGDLLLTRISEFAAAAEDYSRVIQTRPDFAPAYYARAVAYCQLGKTVEALADVERAIALKPEFASAYVVRGILRVRMDQPAAAIRDLDRAIELDPSFANAYFNRSLAHAARQQFASAYADADKARALGFTVDEGYLEDLRRRSGRFAE